ncbi:MAG: hypothetical protein QOH71_4121 [Blastocatellia bacterium]|jgi:hypothetical protein|nr:hypothetical protein [Blastocatellia bacterium]
MPHLKTKHWIKLAFLVLVCSVWHIPEARAATRTWTGATDTDWTKASNWGGTAPVAADTANIPGGLARYPTIITSVTIATISINSASSGASVTVSTGGTLTVTTALTVNANGTLVVNGGTVLSSVTLTDNGSVNISSGTIHMASALATTPTAAIIIGVGDTFTQSGGAVDVFDFTTTAGAPAGTYNQSNGTFKIYRDFKSSGTFNSTGGTIQFAAAGTVASWPATTGSTQFFNVQLDVDPVFTSNAAISFSVAGNWTANAAVNMSAKATTVTFNGTGAQTIGGSATTTFANVTINKSSGTTTLARLETLTGGNLSISAGTLDLSSFTMNRSASGGTLSVSNGATLKIGGTNTFPTNYVTHSLGATSTVEFGGAAQTVTTESYGHLTLSGSGIKTMPGSAITIAGNFSTAGTVSATAAQALTVNGNFTVGSGTTFGAASFSHVVKGNFSNSGTFNASTSTFTFNGASTQSIGGSNSTTFNSLTLNNSNGISLSSVDITVGGTLTFTSGKIVTGSNLVIIPASGTVSRTSGHVVGNLKKNVATGATSRTFEVGDASNYAPVNISFASVSTAGNLTVVTTSGDHPNVASSTLVPSKTVNRYWTLINSGIVFTNYSGTFNFVGGDLDAGVNTAALIVAEYSGAAWTYPTVGTRTGASTQATGLTAFGDFQLGEGAPTVALTKTVTPSGTQSPGTDLIYSVSFTNSGAAIAQSLVITDPTPANTDFKVGSVTTNMGTTGLTVAVAYSNDSGSTWTYSPASGGGGAAAGYDRNVTNIRWTFTGNLSQTSPNNSGSVGFTARIQ